MAVDVSKIPNNNKFDPVRVAILNLQGQIEDTGATIGNGTLTINTSGILTGSGTFTANQTGPSTISIGIDGAEYLTNITHDTVNQKLVVTRGDATTFDIDLSQYIDDTNLARLVSGTLDNQTGIATFTRDDATTFDVDLSALFDDTDTNDFLIAASFNTADGIVTFTVQNQTDVTVDLDGRYPLVSDLDDFITLGDLSTSTNATPFGSGALLYDQATGDFEYTPPDLSGFVSSSELDNYLEFTDLSANNFPNDPAFPGGKIEYSDTTGSISFYAADTSASSLTLQDVTDNGATTTNSITVGELTTTGNLYIGTVGQQNYIAFSGTTGDGGSTATYTTTYIGERIYGGTERSELLIYKGNDGHAGTASPDRIRMIGANICFDTYNIAQGYPTDLDGVAALTTTRAMTINTDGGIVATQSVTAANFQKSGGTQTQFLKADGTTTELSITTGSGLGGGQLLYDAATGVFDFNPADLSGLATTTQLNGYLPLAGGSLSGLLTTSQVNFLGDATFSTKATFNNVAVFNGQVNYNSEDRSTYWSYDNKVAAVFKPAADDGAVAILFPSIGNSVSDFGYIAFDEDYGEAGVTAGENSALIIGCENDGLNSSDHVRVKGRLVVEADMSSSDPTVAFDVKDGNNTDYLFRVNRSGSVLTGSTLNVADELRVDDAIRLTSNPTITGDSSGVYFWNQAGVGATIASNAFQVKTGGNTTALNITNSQDSTFYGNLHINANATNTISFTDGGTHTEMNADVVLRVNQRTEVWGGGTAATSYLDVRDYLGNRNIFLNGGGDSYFSNALGVGRTDADYKLDVSSSSATVFRAYSDGYANIDIESARTSGNIGGVRWETAGDAYKTAEINAIVNGGLAFRTGTGSSNVSTKMFIDANGKVGIGTDSPDRNLHVVDNTEEVVRIQSGTTGSIHFFEGSTRRGIVGYSNGTSIASAADAGDMIFRAESGNKVHLATSSVAVLTVDGTSVGIGTTSPLVKLSLGGGIGQKLNVYESGNTRIGLGADIGGSGHYGLSLYTNVSMTFGKISTSDGSTFTEFARFNSSGNFGIGTSAPQAKLDVNGTVLLGREHGVTQLHNNKDYNNMASGLVWREYNATGTYAHATSSTTLSDYIKAYNFTEQGIASTVNSFTRSDDTYAVEFVGYYYANVDGIHEFSISSDDSGDIFIDGTRVGYWYGGHGDNDAPTGGSLGSGGGTVQTPGSIYLVKGFHRLYARFQDGTGGDSASLWQKEPSGSWEKIPSTRFFHKADDLLRATGSGDAALYGDLRIGQISTASQLTINRPSDGNNAGAVGYFSTANSDFGLRNGSGGGDIRFYSNDGTYRFYSGSNYGTQILTITNAGTATFKGDVIAYGSPSDISLKENIKPIEGALDKVKKLKGVTFDWKQQDDQILDIKEDYGFIAQEVQEVLPELVRENENGKLSLRDKGIISVLVEAIKEQQKQIDELKARLDA